MLGYFYDTPFHIVTRFVLWCYFKVFYGIKISGRKNIPLTGAVLIAPNHQSFYDAPLVGFAVPRRIYFMSKKKYMDVPLLGLLMRILRAFPIENQNDRKAYANILKTLESGKCLTIYPEGERTRTGDLEPIQPGVPRMALKTGATIVPMSILGAYEVWPHSQKFPSFFKKIVLKYHRPIMVEACHDKQQLKIQMEEIRQELERVLSRRVRAWQRLKKIRQK